MESECIMEAIVAVSDKPNKNGVAYSKDSLRRIADGKTFFWDEDLGQLSIKADERLLFDHKAVSELFRTRIMESKTTTWQTKKED